MTSTLQAYGAGLAMGTGTTVNGRNDIIYGNIAPQYPDFAGNPSITYSCSSQPLSGPGTIVADPLFVAGPLGAYYLSQIAAGQTTTSFCVDGGDPDAPIVTGTTRTDGVQDALPVDMGYHYLIATAAPQFDVTMTPMNPPITIPAQGGSFTFTAAVVNHGPTVSPFAIWAKMRLPNGTWIGPLFGPVSITPPVGVTVQRLRNQNIPASYAPGVYYDVGYSALVYPGPVVDSSYFTFTKNAVASGGPTIWDAVCSGELFSDEGMAAAPATMSLLNASPNPFNPKTTISFVLPSASRVALRVFDVQGKLVTTLVESWREAGTHQVTFDGSNLASGMYLYTLTAGENSEAGKMMLLK